MRASLADPSWHELNDANNSNKTMKNYVSTYVGIQAKLEQKVQDGF
jgi:hypothetical protein